MAVGFVPIQNPSHSAYGMRGIIMVLICFPFLVGKMSSMLLHEFLAILYNNAFGILVNALACQIIHWGILVESV